MAYRVFFLNDVEPRTEEPNYSLWRYMVFNAIYKVMYHVKDIKDIVIATDDKVSWRHLYWERYKESRKKKRDEEVDWQKFYDNLNGFVDDLRTMIPFITLHIKHAEADDIIAVVCQDTDYEHYHIVSNDQDYLQLSSDRVTIYNPSKKEEVSVRDTERFILEKCFTGQAKDYILNIKTPLDWPEGKRKPGFGIKSFEKVYQEGYEEWLEKNDLRDRYEFNRNLVDFGRIPNTIRQRVLSAMETYEKPSPEQIHNFFKKHQFREFLEDFHTVESTLTRLY